MDELLITGAAGLVGSVLRRGLADRYVVRAIDRSPHGARDVRRVDLTRRRSLERAVRGCDAVIHLAAVARGEIDWRTVQRNNLRATVNVLEAARRAGVRRFVYASSNHVTGMYERDQPYAALVAGEYGALRPEEIPLIGVESPIRPDGPYGVDKAFGEAAARYYADAFGLQVICLRIGSVLAGDRPTRPRHYSTLLTHRDLVTLVACALEAPSELRYGIYYGVSANTWRFWDLAPARDDIGYEPQDDAELLRD